MLLRGGEIKGNGRAVCSASISVSAIDNEGRDYEKRAYMVYTTTTLSLFPVCH